MMRKDNIEEDDRDMSTDEEDSEKDNVVKENKGEKNVVSSGIYHENRNKSVNSLLLFTTAELDDFNVGKYFTVYWPKPRAYYWGKLKTSSLKKCKVLLIRLKLNGIGRQLKIRASLMLLYVL